MPDKSLATALFLTFTLCLSGVAAHAEQKKDRPSHGRDNDSRGNDKGTNRPDAEWTADPERGWVRTDERQNTQRQNQPENNKQDRGKSKGK